MLRIDPKLKTGVDIALALAVCCAAVILSGCGSSEPAVTPVAPPPPTATHTAAAGTAVDVELPFEGIALDSPVARVKDKNGLEFLRFNYTDREDKVYECVLPAAMAQGKRRPSDWVSLFDVYKKPKVLAQKRPGEATGDQLSDLPLISPKPREAPKTEPEKIRPNISMPAMPTSPTTPGMQPPEGSMPSRPGMPPPGGPMPGRLGMPPSGRPVPGGRPTE